jgi:sulfatase maturation enzyme AslB (radical SAM superfamily)
LVGRSVFNRAVSAIKYLRDNGYQSSIGMLCTVYAENYDHLGEVARFGNDIGLDYIYFRPLFPQTVADRREDVDRETVSDLMVPDLSVLKASIDELKDLKERGLPIADTDEQLDAIVGMADGSFVGKTGCKLMYESIHIKPNGNVDACGHMALGVLGNVATTPVADVLSAEQAWSVRHSVDRKCNCLGNLFVRRSLRSKTAAVLDLIG